MFIDPTGNAWYHWIVGGAIVAAAATAVVVTAGGALPALSAVGSVAGGTAAATMGSTVAAGAFLGSSAIYGIIALDAAARSQSIEDFNAEGNWGTVVFTAGGLLVGGANGYRLSIINKVTIAGRGHSAGARIDATNLNEQLAMKQVMSNPLQGATRLNITMTDPLAVKRWLG